MPSLLGALRQFQACGPPLSFMWHRRGAAPTRHRVFRTPKAPQYGGRPSGRAALTIQRSMLQRVPQRLRAAAVAGRPQRAKPCNTANRSSRDADAVLPKPEGEELSMQVGEGVLGRGNGLFQAQLNQWARRNRDINTLNGQPNSVRVHKRQDAQIPLEVCVPVRCHQQARYSDSRPQQPATLHTSSFTAPQGAYNCGRSCFGCGESYATCPSASMHAFRPSRCRQDCLNQSCGMLLSACA